jgi:hypothetical protein
MTARAAAANLTTTNTNAHASSAELPLEIKGGHYQVSARVNGEGPWSFVLDTGFGITTMNADKAESLNLRRAGQITIEGIAGKREVNVMGGPVFDFGGLMYRPRRIAAMPVEGSRKPRQEGYLGSTFFHRFVVEIDGVARKVRLWEPDRYKYAGNGEVIEMTFQRNTPIVPATLQAKGRKPVETQFELDTGCTGGLCLGAEFVKSNRIPTASDESGIRSGVGGGVSTVAGRIQSVRLGQLSVAEPETDCFTVGSPSDPGLAGHIGLGVLREFRVILDYSRKRVILEPTARPVQKKR